MKSPPVKHSWITLCIEIHNFHVSQVKAESSWTVEKTAQSLSRSIGSVSQCLTLASWLRTHEKQLRKFKNAKDALEFVRAKKKEMQIREFDA